MSRSIRPQIRRLLLFIRFIRINIHTYKIQRSIKRLRKENDQLREMCFRRGINTPSLITKERPR